MEMVLLACRCMSLLTCVPVQNEVLLVKVKTVHSDYFSCCLQHEYYNHELYPLTCATIKNHTDLDLACCYQKYYVNNVQNCLQCELLNCLAEEECRFCPNQTNVQKVLSECVTYRCEFMFEAGLAP